MSGTWVFREVAAAAAAVVRSLRDRIRVESASSLARFRRNRTTTAP